jgi:hypothetical protein
MYKCFVSDWLKNRSFQIVLFCILLVISSCGSGGDQSGKQIIDIKIDTNHINDKLKVVQSVNETLNLIQNSLKYQFDSLNQIMDAHKFILRVLGSNMTKEFGDELTVQLRIIEIAYSQYRTLYNTISFMRDHNNGGEITSEQTKKLIAGMDSLYNNLDIIVNVNQIQTSRQSFKAHINDYINILISNDTGNTKAYLEIRAALDPDNLDRRIAVQKNILNDLKEIMNIIK